MTCKYEALYSTLVRMGVPQPPYLLMKYLMRLRTEKSQGIEETQ